MSVLRVIPSFIPPTTRRAPRPCLSGGARERLDARSHLHAHLGRRPRPNARARGFTLIELMVVVSIIAILSAMAIPTMGRAQFDRRVFTDAGFVGELVRMARIRAVGRGGAVLVALTPAQVAGGGAGTFQMFDAVTANPSGTGANAFPISTCKAPTLWPGAGGVAGTNYQFIDQVALNGATDQQAGVLSTLIDPSGATLASGGTAYLCFTPGGRVYYAATTPTFDGVGPMTGALQVSLYRYDTGSSAVVGLTRTLWISPSGGARITSQ